MDMHYKYKMCPLEAEEEETGRAMYREERAVQTDGGE